MPLPEEPLEDAVYGTYDPGQQPLVSQAPPEPPPPGSVDPGPGATPPEPAAEPPLPEFDPRYREDFEGLLYIGALTDEFTWLGHRFVIRTLRTSELTEVGRVVKDYAGTDSYLKAWQGAIVAACVVAVDGRPLPVVPLTNEPSDTMIRANFHYVMDHWFPPVLDKIYERYVELELTVRMVIEAMGKVSG